MGVVERFIEFNALPTSRKTCRSWVPSWMTLVILVTSWWAMRRPGDGRLGRGPRGRRPRTPATNALHKPVLTYSAFG